MIDGDIGNRTQRLVREWAELHQAELQQDWDLARANQPLNAIAPLE